MRERDWKPGPLRQSERFLGEDQPDRLVRIDWRSGAGREVEIVCRRHEPKLLAALKYLGLSCIGEWARDGQVCTRCARDEGAGA